MQNSSFYFRLNIGSQNIQHVLFLCLIYCLIPVFIVFPCSFGFASSGKQQIRQEFHSQPIVFGKVLQNSNFAVSALSLSNRIDSFLDRVVKSVNTFLSVYQKSSNKSNDNADDADDDWDVQVMLLSTLFCLIIALLKYIKSQRKNQPERSDRLYCFC